MQSGIKLISRIYLKLVLLQVAVGTLLRIVLLFNEQTSDISFTFGQWLKIFLLGAVNDWCALTIGFAVLWLFALSIAPGKYARPLGYILFGILSVAWIYVTFFNTIFDEYGSVVPLIASILFGFWAVSFGLRLFLPQIRPGWSRTWLAVLTGLYTGGIILNAVSEWFFWSEFGVRYNFIAVDYLVYTNEVVGNIMESYPVIPMTLGIVVVTLLVTWYFFRSELVQTECLKGNGKRPYRPPTCCSPWAAACSCSSTPDSSKAPTPMPTSCKPPEPTSSTTHL